MKSLFSRRRQKSNGLGTRTSPSRHYRRAVVEALEGRNLLAAFIWDNTKLGSRNWGDDANWIGTNKPAANSNIEISLANANAELTINMPAGAETTMGLITVKTGKVTFNLNGQNFNTWGLFVEAGANGASSATITNSGNELKYFSGPSVTVRAGQTLTLSGANAGIEAGEVRVGDSGDTATLATMTVTQAALLWVNQEIEINAGTLNLIQSGQLDSPVLKIGGTQTVDGQFNVEDEGSEAVIDNITVANDGDATMTIQSGGRVDAGYVTVAEMRKSGTVNVSGSDSKLIIDVSLFIGSFGKGSMTITDGATAEAEYLGIGVFGEGSMTVGEGATMENYWAYIGTNTSEGFVAVTGSASWSMNTLYVFSGELLIDDGGEVDTVVDASISGSQPSVYVGANSTWTVGLTLNVASPFAGELTINGANALVQCGKGNFAGAPDGNRIRVVRILAGGKWKATSEDDFLLGSDIDASFVEINEGILEANGKIIPGSKTIIAGKATLMSAVEFDASSLTKIIAGGDDVLGATTLDTLSANTPIVFLELGDAGESDQILATGDLSVAGTLNVSTLTDPATYNIGDEFTLVEADGTLSGSFEGLTNGVPATLAALAALPKLRQGLTWMATYADNEVVLHVICDIEHLTSDSQRIDLAPNANIEIAAQVNVGSGYGYGYGYFAGLGYGYGYAGTAIFDLGDNPASLPEQPAAINWFSGYSRNFDLYVSDENEITFELDGYTPKVYSFSGDLTDLFIRAFSNTSNATVTVSNLILNDDGEGGGIELGTNAIANTVNTPDIVWVAGLGSQFTSLSGTLAFDFSTAGSSGTFSSGDISMQILLGTSEDLAPVTVDSSINTAGHVTLDWSTPSANATLIEIDRSDDGGDTWSTIYTSSSMTSSTYTDTSGDHVNSIYKVNQVEFGWLDVPTTHIPAANPTLTVNLNSSGDLAGVKFEIDEEDSALMNILVDDVETASVNWGRIGELIINGTSDDDDITISGDLFAALTFHNDDGDDALTFSGGNWGQWGAPVSWDGDNPICITAIDGAWLTLDVETELADLFIGEDSAVTSDLTGEDVLTVGGELTLDENAALVILGGEFDHSGSGSADYNSTIELSGEATASLGESDTFTNNGDIIVVDATIDLGEHFVNSGNFDIAGEATVNADEELEAIGGTVNVFGTPTLNLAEAVMSSNVNWYSSDASALPELDTSATFYFMEDVDLSDISFTSGHYYLAEGVTATVDGNLDLDGGSMSFSEGSSLYVTGGTFTIAGGSSYISAGGFVDISDANVVLEDGGYLWGYGGLNLSNSTVTVNTSMGAGNGLIWNINDGSTLDIYSTFDNQGTLNINDGEVIVRSGATFHNSANGAPVYLNVFAGGVFTIAAGGLLINHLDSQSAVINIDGGTFTNAGTIRWQTADVAAVTDIDNTGTIVFETNVDLAALTLDSGSTFEIATGYTAAVSSNWTMNGTLIVNFDAMLVPETSVTLTNYGEIDLPTGHDDSFIDNQGSGFVVFV